MYSGLFQIFYSEIWFQDLNKDLKSELTGNFEDLILALMTPTVEYQAKELNYAISGVGTNEQTLVELLCSATNQEIHHMRAAYERRECYIVFGIPQGWLLVTRQAL